MHVYKFGGASIKNAESIKNAADIVKSYPTEKLIIVVSAMQNVTNMLENLTYAYYHQKDNMHSIFDEIKLYHQNIVEQLFDDKQNTVFDEVANTFVEIDWALEDPPHPDYDFNYDQIVSIGELVSTRIFSAYLNKIGISNQWMDVRSSIQTDNHYREGKVDWEKTKELVAKNFGNTTVSTYVTQGFLGGTSENFTTTLGRDGSDYTAAILASCLQAEGVTIWKDVPGVLNADPKWFEETQKIPILSYREAIELTYYGANVIHPKTIKPLQNQNIPLYVRSFIDYTQEGTTINNETDWLPVPSFIFKVNQVLISISSKDFSFIVEDNLSEIFAIFHKNHIRINTMFNSAISFSVSVDFQNSLIENLLKELSERFEIKYNTGLELVTIRHYNNDTIERVTTDKSILLEVKSRYTCQMVMKPN